MDTTRFDELIAGFAQSPTRRGVLRLLGAATFGAGGLALLDDAEAKKRRKKGKKKKKATCNDGKKNGSETDVDCGGNCKRCALEKTCKTRDDCITALCTDNACASCVANDDCGLDSNGEGCFCRDISTGARACTRQLGRFLLNGTCADCRDPEVCVPMGNSVECNLPCGLAV